MKIIHQQLVWQNNQSSMVVPIKCHFVREQVSNGKLELCKILQDI